MKVLVAGASGMLGHKVYQAVKRRFADSAGSIRGRRSDEAYRSLPILQSSDILERFDALDLPGVRAQLRSHRPAFIVNCIGVVKQRPDAHDEIASIAVNSLLPHVLAATCAEWQGRLIHISTDCVFTGTRGGYCESDLPDAADLYGRTKALGEPTAPNALTLRTSIIGRELAHRGSLLEWLLSNEGNSVRGFTRAIYSGVTTNHLALVIANIIADSPALTGLYHLAADPISKYELLLRLRDAYGLRVEITPDDSFVSDRSMLGDKLNAAIGYRAPAWSQLLAELTSDTTPYSEWRQTK